ncbi:hypothetical protein AK830_g3311 [Neonectria ditissima]|uniref:Uncharacterized protein n=1 Tax=Neonectria ditissima TaxID=78410 RepID=A0A0P7BQS2_9HYPO|nr:hypothetical protein AK830_g3311 [Neonectria ditissima]
MLPFPEEIWTRIFAELECMLSMDYWWLYGDRVDCSTLKTLASLCLVCRDFRRMAQSVLYRTIPLESLQGPETKQRFARSLAEVPLLGRLTRRVSLNDSIPDHGFNLKDMLDTIKDCPSIPTKLSMQLQRLRSSSRWSRDGFDVLMLAFMPRVQLVDCTVGESSGLLPWALSGDLQTDYVAARNEDPQYMEDQEDQNPAGTPTATESLEQTWLPALRHVHLRTGDCVEGTTGVSWMEALLLNPRLETLRLLGFDWTGYEVNLMRQKYQPCSFTLLQLKESIVDASGLQNILKRCNKLADLTIELGDSRREGWDREEDSWEVDLDQFGALLRKHGKNLTALDLHTEEYKAAHSADGRIGSLRELNALKHLRITKVDLLGSSYETQSPGKLRLEDALPHSLETLYLHFEDSYYAGQGIDKQGHQELYELITGGQFSDLREVKVEFYLTDPSRCFGREIAGWKVRTIEEHLWERVASTGCLRSILVFTRMS